MRNGNITTQVADQLVQFRSLTDIVSVKRTLGGAFSVFGRRRVFRGIPAVENASPGSEGCQTPPARARSPPRSNSSHAMAASTSTSSSKFGIAGIDGNVDGGVGSAHPCGTTATVVTSDRATKADAVCTATEATTTGAGAAGADAGADGGPYSNLVAMGAKERAAEVPARANEAPENGRVTPSPSVDAADLKPSESSSESGAREAGDARTEPAREAAAVEVVGEGLRKKGEMVGDTPGEAWSGLEEGLGLEVDDADLNERVEHLVLVVHGIGDALMSVDLGVVQLRSLVECCDTMRDHHEEART